MDRGASSWSCERGRKRHQQGEGKVPSLVAVVDGQGDQKEAFGGVQEQHEAIFHASVRPFAKGIEE